MNNIKTVNETIKLTRKQIWKVFEVQKNNIVDWYFKDKLSCDTIGQKIGLKESTIYFFLRRHNIPIRARHNINQYPIDDSYFEKIDSNEKAYFLGWLLSDGCVGGKGNTAISLNLQERDRIVLENFKKSLKADVPLQYLKPRKAFNTTSIISPQWKLTFCNKRIALDLTKLGMFPRKSLILKFPIIEEEFIAPMLRGYLEGDGCLMVRKKKKSTVAPIFYFQMCGTKDFLRGVINYYNNKFGIKFSVTQRTSWKDRNINMYSLYTSNKVDILIILDEMYKDCGNLHLPRKYVIYQQMKQFEVENSPLKKRNRYKPKSVPIEFLN